MTTTTPLKLTIDPAPRTQHDADDDALATSRSQIHRNVVAALGPRLARRDVQSDAPDPAITAAILECIQRSDLPLSQRERDRLLSDVRADVLGFGPIDTYVRDESVTEIMVNGPHQVYVERAGRIEQTRTRFVDDEHVARIIDRIVSQVGRRIDESSPMVDARLPDGSRVNAVVPPLSLVGPCLTIRKFRSDPYRIEDLIELGTLTHQAAHFLELCVQGSANILVSGGTGSGKTTLLNVLSAAIPESERIVTVEDAAELRLHQEHVISLESRPPNVEGRGEVRIRDLVRNCLRMRPDRIVVGECRGPEAVDMLQAMNTGHDGSMTTIHANSPRDALARVETLVLTSGVDLPMRAIREQVSGALHLVVHISRLVDGTRRVTHISEVVEMEADVVTMQDLFAARPEQGAGSSVGSPGRLYGPLVATGVKPTFLEHLAANGVRIPDGLFAANHADDPAVMARSRQRPPACGASFAVAPPRPMASIPRHAPVRDGFASSHHQQPPNGE